MEAGLQALWGTIVTNPWRLIGWGIVAFVGWVLALCLALAFFPNSEDSK